MKACSGTWQWAPGAAGASCASASRSRTSASRLCCAPDGGIDTLITADAYGAGEADALLGRALAGVPREHYSLVGAVGHDFYEGEREGAKGYPRFTDPRLRGPDGYGDYLRMAVERSLERCGVDSFDLLLLHNPDRRGFESPEVWEALSGLRDEGLARRDRRRPRPRERLHARPDRLLRALRRADRLGDADPEPVRAVARRARARRRRPPRREGDHPRGRLRRPLPRRRPPRPPLRLPRPPRLPPGGMGRGRPRAARAHQADRRPPRAHAAPARLRVEPRAPRGRVRRADADPGAGAGRQADRAQARGAGRRARRPRPDRRGGRRDPRRSATTAARCC